MAIYLYGTRQIAEVISGCVSTADVLYCVSGNMYRGRLWDLEADGGIMEVVSAIHLAQKRRVPRAEAQNHKRRTTER